MAAETAARLAAELDRVPHQLGWLIFVADTGRLLQFAGDLEKDAPKHAETTQNVLRHVYGALTQIPPPPAAAAGDAVPDALERLRVDFKDVAFLITQHAGLTALCKVKQVREES